MQSPLRPALPFKAPECNSQVLASGFLVEKGTWISSGWIHRSRCQALLTTRGPVALGSSSGRLVSQPHPWVPWECVPAPSWPCAGPGVLSFLLFISTKIIIIATAAA